MAVLVGRRGGPEQFVYAYGLVFHPGASSGYHE